MNGPVLMPSAATASRPTTSGAAAANDGRLRTAVPCGWLGWGAEQHPAGAGGDRGEREQGEQEGRGDGPAETGGGAGAGDAQFAGEQR